VAKVSAVATVPIAVDVLAATGVLNVSDIPSVIGVPAGVNIPSVTVVSIVSCVPAVCVPCLCSYFCCQVLLLWCPYCCFYPFLCQCFHRLMASLLLSASPAVLVDSCAALRPAADLFLPLVLRPWSPCYG